MRLFNEFMYTIDIFKIPTFLRRSSKNNGNSFDDIGCPYRSKSYKPLTLSRSSSTWGWRWRWRWRWEPRSPRTGWACGAGWPAARRDGTRWPGPGCLGGRWTRSGSASSSGPEKLGPVYSERPAWSEVSFRWKARAALRRRRSRRRLHGWWTLVKVILNCLA